MRKLVLIAAIAVSSFAFSQEGTLLVGGNVGFSTTKEGEVKSETFNFSPRIGYQFTENWTAGVTTSLKNSTTTSVSKVEYDALQVGAFIRYGQTIGESGLFAVYGDLDLGYQSNKMTSSGVSSTFNGLYGQFTPALFINFNKGFGLNFSIGGIEYNSLKQKNGDVKSTTFGFNFGNTITIGISKNFSL